MNYQLLGQRIRAARLAQKLSQEQLAEIIDCSTAHISHIENASTKHSLETFVAIANALHTSPDQLLCDNIYQSREVLQDELAAIYADTNPDELYIMLNAASAIKQALRTRRINRNV